MKVVDIVWEKGGEWSAYDLTKSMDHEEVLFISIGRASMMALGRCVTIIAETELKWYHNEHSCTVFFGFCVNHSVAP